MNAAVPPTWTITRNDSPWAGFTGSAAEEQAGFTVTAVTALDGLDVPPHLAGDRCDGRPLLAIDRAAGRVVVNAAVFGDLNRPDATRIAAGESLPIGRLRRPAAFADARALAGFLLRAELVRSYAHLEATVTLIAEEEQGGVWCGHFAGHHEYWTDRCHRPRLAFALRIDTTSGEMALLGETPA